MTAALELIPDALRELRAYRAPSDPLPIKLDANESPWALPVAVQQDLAHRVAELGLHRYPDLSARALRAAIAARVGAAEEELLLGVGSDEVINVLLTALRRPRPGRPRPVTLFPSPSFVMYRLSAMVHGHDPVEVPLRADWSLDLDAMREAIDAHDPNLVFVASPNNPTGNAFEEATLAALVAAAPRALVVIDEAYVPFGGRSLSSWVSTHANVAVMGTLSKVGLAALRVGWVRAPRELARELDKARPPYNLPAPSQLIATAMLTSHADALDAQVARITAERARVAAALSALDGVTPCPSQANFILARFRDAGQTHRALASAGVQVRRFSTPQLDAYLRLTIGTPDENDALLAALAADGAL